MTTRLLASALSTDLYEFNMVQAYLDRGDESEAVFEFFVRKLPARRGFLMAAGLETALDYLETLRFSPEEIGWLDAYHARVREVLADLVDAPTRQWLEAATAPLALEPR